MRVCVQASLLQLSCLSCGHNSEQSLCVEHCAGACPPYRTHNHVLPLNACLINPFCLPRFAVSPRTSHTCPLPVVRHRYPTCPRSRHPHEQLPISVHGSSVWVTRINPRSGRSTLGSAMLYAPCNPRKWRSAPLQYA
jgi:hypothetical protein